LGDGANAGVALDTWRSQAWPPKRQNAKGSFLATCSRTIEALGMDLQQIEPPRHLDLLAHSVIGAAIEVHKTLGAGYLESVYERSLAIELQLRKIPFKQQAAFAVDYKGHTVGDSRLDLLVADELVVELKSVERFLAIHHAQTISYLKGGDYRLALLLNFNAATLQIRRVVWNG
jgi:GxxExxY protein